MAAKYEFTPKGPILIEMFPKHDDFAVQDARPARHDRRARRLLRPVVTLDSPKARPPGDFLWEATLWHELGHVITLQMSNQRVPRWLTEGISEYEERRAHREWARQMDFTFASLLNRGETIKLKDLNAAFQDPKLIGIAYYQASLVVDHLVATFGQSGLNKLVRAYGRGLDTETALKDVLQHRLRSAADRLRSVHRARRSAPAESRWSCRRTCSSRRRRSRTLRTLANENPRSYPVQLAYGAALRKAGSTDEAMQVFERAAALAPSATGDDSPHAQMAEIALEKKDRHARDRRAHGVPERRLRERRAPRITWRRCCKEAGVTDPARLRPVYERIVALDPFDADARAALGRMALQRNDVGIRRARVPDRHRAQADRSGRRAHRSRRELPQGRQARRGEAPDAGGARNRADLRARAGSAAEAGGGAAVNRAAVAAAAALSPEPVHCPARRSTALGDRSDDVAAALGRAAVALRPHQVSLRPGRAARACSSTSTASRGASTRRRPNRTCRGA